MKSNNLLLALTGLSFAVSTQAAVVWMVGRDDNNWPLLGVNSAIDASFVQENGNINAMPGSPISTAGAQQADNDYYLAGTYSSIVPANGAYVPVGVVTQDEIAAERAFAGGDLSLRYHFNMPAGYGPNDQLTVTFDAMNLDGTAGLPDPRFGVEVYINGSRVMDQVVIRSPQLDFDYTSTPISISAASVGGLGTDNIVELRGISYNGSGGGNWMGVDYVRLDVTPVPEPGSIAVVGAALLGTGGLLRRRRR